MFIENIKNSWEKTQIQEGSWAEREKPPLEMGESLTQLLRYRSHREKELEKENYEIFFLRVVNGGLFEKF